MWHYSLVHCGAKSLTTIHGNHLTSLRLFQYIWRESCHSRRSNTKVEDSTDLHREQTTICRSFHDDTVTCEKCNNSVEDIIDLRNYTSQKNCGDVIVGDLDNLGWIVVEGNKLTNNVMSDIVAIGNKGGDSKNKWHRIGNNQERYQKFNSTMDVDRFYLEANVDTKSFLRQIKTFLSDRNLPNKKYVIGVTNLLKNFEPIPEDQDPHTDFKY